MQLQDDTVYRFLNACYKAGIKNPAAFIVSKMPVVYDWLKGSFPYGILPTDIDGLVHLNGHFLLLEFKDESVIRNAAIPKGQLRCFESLHLTNRFTVFLIGTDQRGEPVLLQEFHCNGKHPPLKDIDKSCLQKRCKQWAAWAELQRLT
jgi:hypothetical protein